LCFTLFNILIFGILIIISIITCNFHVAQKFAQLNKRCILFRRFPTVIIIFLFCLLFHICLFDKPIFLTTFLCYFGAFFSLFSFSFGNFNWFLIFIIKSKAANLRLQLLNDVLIFIKVHLLTQFWLFLNILQEQIHILLSRTGSCLNTRLSNLSFLVIGLGFLFLFHSRLFNCFFIVCINRFFFFHFIITISFLNLVLKML